MPVSIQEFVLQPAPASPPPAGAASAAAPATPAPLPALQVQRAETALRALALRTFAH